MQVVDWLAYPEYTLNDDLASFVLSPGLYYTSRFGLPLVVCAKHKCNLNVLGLSGLRQPWKCPCWQPPMWPTSSRLTPQWRIHILYSYWVKSIWYLLLTLSNLIEWNSVSSNFRRIGWEKERPCFMKGKNCNRLKKIKLITCIRLLKNCRKYCSQKNIDCGGV